ncbi:hypothetical protein [Hyphomicrobium sulfonivorans]|uniref:hypothetical protein n=1 Tax=Hyphomicrobium sulfonivorans TaxID=121290 RepID=UPI0015700988|nr:hypothetical protein [Hyphomicrobium sulfonivorans]MBI1650688.1 hypothetical protein [Hyphomicrobium sulfonivorans]NSL71955.1 hypothetical protein [Hyphomicrobium sulfonivorans]
MARSGCGLLASVIVALAVGGCAYSGGKTIDAHFSRYKARLPEGNRVFVCSAYGCRTQTPFRFEPADIEEVRTVMAKGAASPAAEREVARKAIAMMGARADKAVGTDKDRPGDDMLGNGDPGQMDCVDVATNLTSYMMVMERHKLFKHHTIGPMFIKEDLRRGFDGWTHYAGTMIENGSGQKFAVDGWLLASGKPPEIVEVERWYIDNDDLLFGAKTTTSSLKPQPADSNKQGDPIVTGSIDKEATKAKETGSKAAEAGNAKAKTNASTTPTAAAKAAAATSSQ